MYSDTKANLSITQSSEYKNIEVVNLDFISVSEVYFLNKISNIPNKQYHIVTSV